MKEKLALNILHTINHYNLLNKKILYNNLIYDFKSFYTILDFQDLPLLELQYLKIFLKTIATYGKNYSYWKNSIPSEK
jgi:hypothetical protein